MDLGIIFDELDAIEKAYSFFLQGSIGTLIDQDGEYVGREIENGIFFGVDKRILDVISETPTPKPARQQTVEAIFDILAERAHAYESRREPTASPGRDGTLLVDRRASPTGRRTSLRPS